MDGELGVETLGGSLEEFRASSKVKPWCEIAYHVVVLVRAWYAWRWCMHAQIELARASVVCMRAHGW